MTSSAHSAAVGAVRRTVTVAITAVAPVDNRQLALTMARKQHAVSGCILAETGYWAAPQLHYGGDHVDDCALPGFDARYLARAPGYNPGRNAKPSLNRICRGLLVRACGTIVMTSNLVLAPRRGAGRSDLLERRLRRYHPRFQGTVRALAMRHSRIADLAASFPALLFALAVPRPGSIRRRARARDRWLCPREAAAAADLPLWLRKLPPEAFARPIARLPDGELFRRQIANHLPRSPKLAPTWLQAVADVAELAHEPAAVWIARELVREPSRVKPARLRLISLWAWFSGPTGNIRDGVDRRPMDAGHAHWLGP
jgi:hypothetical protein